MKIAVFCIFWQEMGWKQAQNGLFLPPGTVIADIP